MNEQEIVIEIRNFTKDYGSGRGCFDVSFSVHKGEFFGFLGPNGAGKSTTIRHLMAFSKPQLGVLKINGKDVLQNRESILRQIGYLPGEVNLPTYLTGDEFLKEQFQLKDITDFTFFNELKKIFPFDTKQEIKQMSLGDKRKLAILSAFMSNPEILILDEPTSGLDPVSQDIFKKFLLKEKENGKTILLSSHIFKEIEDTCDRIAIIKDGRIVSEFNKQDFQLKNKNEFLIIFDTLNDLNIFLSRIGKEIEILNVKKEDNSIHLKIKNNSLNDLFFCLSNLRIKNISELKETLEEYFLSFYKEEKEFKGI